MEAARRLTSTVEHLTSRGYYISKVLAGKDLRFHLSVGSSFSQLQAKLVKEELVHLRSVGLIAPNQAESLLILLKAAAHGDTVAWKALHQASELLQEVQWSLKELSAGIKHL